LKEKFDLEVMKKELERARKIQNGEIVND